MMNERFAYLLGMIVGKGTIQQRNDNTRVVISIPHKAQFSDATHDVHLAVQASIPNILNAIQPLLGMIVQYADGEKETKLFFEKPTNDGIIQEILRMCGGYRTWESMRIPDYFFVNASTEEIRYFLRGLADVTGHARSSNYCRKKADNLHRVYIEIPRNWFLTIDICNLLKKIDIPVHDVNWGHPNIRDGQLTRLKRGYPDFWKKEHQIKILANEFLPIGFTVIHKNAGLIELSDALCATYRQKHNNQDPSIYTHRFYWEIRPRNSQKPSHPGENDVFIPAEIRGRHFNSWREIAFELGYRGD